MARAQPRGGVLGGHAGEGGSSDGEDDAAEGVGPLGAQEGEEVEPLAAVLVVGGGTVAARSAKALLDAGAQVTLVAPVLSAPARALADAGLLTWHARGYESADITGLWYTVAASGSATVDGQVARDAEASRTWCVNHSMEQDSAAWAPSVATFDDLQVAVSAGGNPLRAVSVRNAIAAALESGDLPLRSHRKVLDKQEIHGLDLASLPGLSAGRVALVGGGPGAEDLITVRGRRLLAEADVVVADRLGPRGLLDTLSEGVRIIEVGKTPGHHPVPQTDINAILVREALAGNRVVRLKGGDPYVLGRGGEEAIACRKWCRCGSRPGGHERRERPGSCRDPGDSPRPGQGLHYDQRPRGLGHCAPR